MAFKGARSDPVQGTKGSKPRLRRPKLPRRPETAESAKLGEEYLRKRNALLDLKYKREAMLLARDRDQLIERELVLHQLAYLMIPLAPEDSWNSIETRQPFWQSRGAGA